LNSWTGAIAAARRWAELEARVGIEPTHKGFADLSLTTWVPRPIHTLASRWEKVYGPDVAFQTLDNGGNGTFGGEKSGAGDGI
jgi:hypothetical protein